VPPLPRSHLIAYGLALAVIVVVGLRFAGDGSESPEPAPRAAPIRVDAGDGAGPGGGAVTVHVAGAVRRPGVYRLRAGARAEEAVRRAGGARGRADLSAINLAAKVEDGRQVLVPRRGPTGTAPASSPGTTAAAGGPPSAPLNLNTATPEQLDTLDGVGPATVAKIVEYREAHNGFGSVEELGQITGIGPKRLASLREQVQV